MSRKEAFVTISPNSLGGLPNAAVKIPAGKISLRQFTEVMMTIRNELGEAFIDELKFEVDHNDGACTFNLTVNPFAENDTVNRMLLLQWIMKRLVVYSPPIDISNLREMQHTLH